MRLPLILAVTMALAACAPEPPTATREQLLTATATIESVDPATRTVRLRDNAGGGSFSVTAGDEVRNFDQLAPGDVVTMDYYQAVTLTMAPPGTAATTEGAVAAGRAPEGALPGAAAVVTTTTVVTVTSYDPATGVASFVLPDGTSRTTTVAPEMRDFAAQVQPGDQVEVTLTEAAAISITETAS